MIARLRDRPRVGVVLQEAASVSGESLVMVVGFTGRSAAVPSVVCDCSFEGLYWSAWGGDSVIFPSSKCLLSWHNGSRGITGWVAIL